MTIILLLSLVTLIDGNVSHMEDGFKYEMNPETTLYHCQTNIAPFFEKTVVVGDGISFKIEAKCYEK